MGRTKKAKKKGNGCGQTSNDIKTKQALHYHKDFPVSNYYFRGKVGDTIVTIGIDEYFHFVPTWVNAQTFTSTNLQ